MKIKKMFVFGLLFASIVGTSGVINTYTNNKTNIAHAETAKPEIVVSNKQVTLFEGDEPSSVTLSFEGFSKTPKLYVKNYASAVADATISEDNTTFTFTYKQAGTGSIMLGAENEKELDTAYISIVCLKTETIKEVRKKPNHTQVKVRGTVYGYSKLGTYIADEDGTGILLQQYVNNELKIGDKITAVGKLTYIDGTGRFLAKNTIEVKSIESHDQTVGYLPLNKDTRNYDRVRVENLLFKGFEIPADGKGTKFAKFDLNGELVKFVIDKNDTKLPEAAKLENDAKTWVVDSTRVTITAPFFNSKNPDKVTFTKTLNCVTGSTWEVSTAKTLTKVYDSHLNSTCSLFINSNKAVDNLFQKQFNK